MMVQPPLERAAALRPDRAALESPDGVLAYAELLDRARAGAQALAERGVRRGDRVALRLPAGEAFVVALHACLLLGAAAMPVDLRLGEREQRLQLASAATAVDDRIVVGAPNAPTAIRRADTPSRSPEVQPLEDVALVVHTSGTTGDPQPVELTHGNVLANALGTAVALGHDPAERWLCPLPLTHVGGLMVLLRSAIFATTAVLGPADRIGVTLASLVPTQLSRLLEAGTPPPATLRTVMLGGAPADPTLLRRARDAGWPVSPSYGLTQACSAVTLAEPGDLESSGAPLPGLRVEIAPDGEILVHGPTVAGGGVLRTGDLGRLDARGRLHVVGRKSDTIVTGGENVAPAEVEAVLLEHPAVREAGVFGRPDPTWGEAVTAKVVLRDGAGPEELRAWCAARLARYKVPKAIEPADELPRNAAGKLLRRALS
jgi:o-succinylbenzoate---CoA ligase